MKGKETKRRQRGRRKERVAAHSFASLFIWCLPGFFVYTETKLEQQRKQTNPTLQDIICCVGVLIRDQQITHVKRFYWHGELLNYTKLCVGVELLFLGPSFVSRLNNVRVVLISDTHGPHARVPLRLWIGLEWIMARVI